MTPVEHYKNLSLDNIVEEIDGVVYTERWLPIVGYEKLYQVSSFGRIKRLPRLDDINHFWSEIIIKSFFSHKYRRIGLFKDGMQIKYQVHRLVAFAFIPNPSKLSQVNHKNGIRHDNRFWMLEWITSSDNHRHAFKELGKKANSPWLGKSGALSPRSHHVLLVSLDGFVIDEYGSKAEAARIHKVCAHTLMNYIKYGESFNGYYFK
jgi:hypothetical protein